MAKKKDNIPQREERVPQREAYRYSGNPDDMPNVNQDKAMPVVSPVPTFFPSRRRTERSADELPQKYSPEAPSGEVTPGGYDKMHLPATNSNPDKMPREYSQEVPSELVDPGVYDASRLPSTNHGVDAIPHRVAQDVPTPGVAEGQSGYDKMHLRAMNHGVDKLPQEYSPEAQNPVVNTMGYDAGAIPQVRTTPASRAMNHESDAMPQKAKKDVPTAGNAVVQAPTSGSGVPNIFTSGGVRGAFESAPKSVSTPAPKSASGESPSSDEMPAPFKSWEELGKRQPIGWSAKGEPVYEWNGFDEDKRPPLNNAVEQAYDPVLQERPRANAKQSKEPEFRKDPEKKDGGFMKWLGGLFKPRKGKREGETDDEYDERMTRNNMRILTIGNALRHMANLYYTSKGGLPQQFNDPNAELEKGLKERKAERAQKAALAASQAYKNAQLQLQRDKAEADKYYKNMSLYYQGRNADREDNKFDWEKDKDRWNRNRLSANDSWKHNFEERKQKATEGYQRGRLAVEGKKAKAAMLKATGGSSGGALGNMTNLASPKGHLNRKKELSVVEENQIFNFLRKNGNITKDYIAGWGSLTPEEKRAKIQSAIAYAASDPSKEGKRAREYLKKHHGYTEAATSAVGGLDFN